MPDRLDIDYAAVAIHNDKSTSVGHTQKDLKPLHLPKKLPNVILDDPDGVVVEDKQGTILAIRIPGALKGLNVSAI
jgi:hypothetical protein